METSVIEAERATLEKRLQAVSSAPSAFAAVAATTSGSLVWFATP